MNRPPLPILAMLVATFCAASVSGQSAPAPEDESERPGIDAAMAATADEVLKLLGGAKEVAVGDFQCPNSSAGPRIALAISKALTARNVIVNDKAMYRVAGTFTVQGKTAGGAAELNMTIAPKLLGGTETRPLAPQVVLDDNEVIGAVSTPGWAASKAARTGATTKGGDPKWLEELFSPPPPQAVEGSVPNAAEPKPAVVIERGHTVRPTGDDRFGLEVLRLEGGRFEPCQVAGNGTDEICTVKIGLTDILAFGVHNNSGEPVGVAVFIDGINILEFSKQWRERGKWYLKPHDRGMPAARFTGWHSHDDKVNAFQVTYPDALHALLGREQTISVAFYKVLPPKQLGAGAKAITIGQGAEHEMKIEEVVSEFGKAPLAIINLRYEAIGADSEP